MLIIWVNLTMQRYCFCGIWPKKCSEIMHPMKNRLNCLLSISYSIVAVKKSEMVCVLGLRMCDFLCNFAAKIAKIC